MYEKEIKKSFVFFVSFVYFVLKKEAGVSSRFSIFLFYCETPNSFRGLKPTAINIEPLRGSS